MSPIKVHVCLEPVPEGWGTPAKWKFVTIEAPAKPKPPSRALATNQVKGMGRKTVVERLESIGVACYDDEGLEKLRASLVESILSGDIDVRGNVFCY